MDIKPQPIAGGLLIVFEGIDGTGKTTQLELARVWLQSAGWPVFVTRNLGGTPIGEALRQVMLSPIERPSKTNLYISVAIQEALVGTVEEQRAAGNIILMDRGPLSLAAYEIYGSQLGEKLGWPFVEDGMAILKPELTILYEMSVSAALNRAKNKSGKTDYFESKDNSYFERVAKGYKTALERFEATATVDAEQAIESVQANTKAAIEATISHKLTQL